MSAKSLGPASLAPSRRGCPRPSCLAGVGVSASPSNRSPSHQRVLAVAVAVSAGPLLGACQRSAPSGAHSVASPATTGTARTAAAPGVGDRVALGTAGGSVRLMAVEADVDAGRLYAPPRGSQYFAVQVEGCAGPGEAAVAFKPDYFSVELADHTVRDAGPSMKKPDLRGGPIPSGHCLDGWVTFVIPRHQDVVTVVYDGSQSVHWALATTPNH